MGTSGVDSDGTIRSSTSERTEAMLLPRTVIALGGWSTRVYSSTTTVARVVEDPVYVGGFPEGANAPCRGAASFRLCADLPAQRYPFC